MPVTVITSADPGAPALDGQIGSMLPVLDFCLLRPSLAWTKPFVGVNVAAYRSTSGFYLRVEDAGAVDPRMVRLRGFTAMTTVNLGTDRFPFDLGLEPDGVFAEKSMSADATPRPWRCTADGRTFTFSALAEVDGFGVPCWRHFHFGDFVPAVPDAFNCVLIGQDPVAGAEAPALRDDFCRAFISPDSPLVGFSTFMARSWDQVSAVLVGSVCGYGSAMGFLYDAVMGGMLPLPSAVPPSMATLSPVPVLAPLLLYENFATGVGTIWVLRGRLRGPWFQCHPPTPNQIFLAGTTAFTTLYPDGASLVNLPNYGGRAFSVTDPTSFTGGNVASFDSPIVMEVSDTWDLLSMAVPPAFAMGNRSVIHMGSP